MTEQRIPSQWQLQNTGEPLEQWMLHEEEQNLPEHMQLHQDPQQPGRGYTQQGGYQQGYPADAAWQPIDYRAMQQAAQRPSNRGGLVLGGLLIAILLGVGGYLAWFYGGQPDLFSLTQASTTPEATVDPALAGSPEGSEVATQMPVVPAVAAVESPTPEPTLLPTATPYLVEVRRVTVNSEFGVNARPAASAEGTLIETLGNGASFLIAAGPATGVDGAQWYEIVMTDNTRAYVSAEFVTPASEFIAYDDAVRILEAANLAAPAPPVVVTAALTEVAAIPAPAVVTTTRASTATGALTGSDALTVETDSPAAQTAAARVITVSAVISAPAGLNLRSTPAAGENVIQIVTDTLPIDVIGRSADGEWLQVQLAEGVRGWVAESFVNPVSTIDVIPLGTTQPLTSTVPLLPIGVDQTGLSVASAAGATNAVTTTTAATGTAGLTTTAPTTTTARDTTIGVGAASASLPTPTPSASAGVTTTTATTGTAAVATPAASTPSVVVTSLAGVNLRPEPSDTAAGSQTLEWNTSYTGIGRTADNAWVQLQLADGTSGWVVQSAVLVNGGVGVLPIVE